MEVLVHLSCHGDMVLFFHLSHVRSLLRNDGFAFGGSDNFPFDTNWTYGDRVADT